MHIGAQLYTVRDFTQTPKDLAATLKKVADIGYKYVHCSKLGPIDPHELRGLLDANGLTCTVTHTDPERLLRDVDGVIAEHKAIGCQDVGMGMMPERYRGSLEGLRRLIADYQPAVGRMLDAGLRFHYHNHDIEYQRVAGRTLLDIMMEEWPGAHLLACTYWVQMGGGDPIAWIQKYGARIRQVHIKDMVYTPQANNFGQHLVMTPILEGNMNYRGILAACAEQGVEFAHVEQDDCYDADPFDCLRKSFENLRGLGYC
ncbi:MAG: sugar phosphate isomerase/epimerase [Clostridia bacterium]|nr:sugar phosphate isomerase/epimerase [Clostridia bacterium]